MTTVAFCEVDPFCRRVLANHWPEVPIYEDVRELDASRLRGDGIDRIDVVTGGYPCQPFSHAGKRGGTADPRHLWPAMRRIVGEVRPAWVIAENVAGHISLGLDQVLADLETDGYSGRAIVVPAAAVDAPHIRQRVWIVARDSDSDSESACAVDAQAQGLRGDMADADGERQQERHVAAESDQARQHPGRNAAGWRAARWPAEPGIRRVVNGLHDGMDGHRLRALGNAVVPQIPEMIGRAIMAHAA
ncbi:MAG: hypothetical protein RL756_690 [Pseudomonadota bacterium]